MSTKKNRGFAIVALILNLLIVELTSYGLYLAIKDDGLMVLKMFTIDSNLLLGIAAFIMAICNIIKIARPNRPYPSFFRNLKFTAAVSTFITMTITFGFLSPVQVLHGGTYLALIIGNSMNIADISQVSYTYLHVLAPFVGVVSVIFDKDVRNGYKTATYGFIPLVVYMIPYVVFAVVPGLKSTYGGDWYGFLDFTLFDDAVINTIVLVAIAIVGMFALALALGTILWALSLIGTTREAKQPRVSYVYDNPDEVTAEEAQPEETPAEEENNQEPEEKPVEETAPVVAEEAEAQPEEVKPGEAVEEPVPEEEQPAEEPSSDEAPVEEQPAEEEAKPEEPVNEEPVAEEPVAAESPVEEEKPVEEPADEPIEEEAAPEEEEKEEPQPEETPAETPAEEPAPAEEAKPEESPKEEPKPEEPAEEGSGRDSKGRFLKKGQKEKSTKHLFQKKNPEEKKETKKAPAKKETKTTDNKSSKKGGTKVAAAKKEAAPAKKTETAKAAPAKKAAAKKEEPAKFNGKARVYHISQHANGYKVQLAGSEKAIKTFKTQKEAIDYAKELVKTQGGTYLIHSLNGSIRKG